RTHRNLAAEVHLAGSSVYERIKRLERDRIILGQSQHTDDAVLAARRSWAGSLVLVDARGTLAERLGRENVCGSRQVVATASRSISCWPFAPACTPGMAHASSSAPSSPIPTK